MTASTMEGAPPLPARTADAAMCAGFDPSIAALGTAALGAEDEARVREHLARCQRCAELARLFAINETTGDALPPPATEARASSLVAGTVIAGRYRLDRILGRGGMGVVWAATQSPTRQPVAVKLLHDRASASRGHRRFLREARAVCAVRHPNVVRVYDVVEAPDGSPALVMELLVGHSLQRRFDRGPIDLAELCHVLARVAAAVGAAHAAGIVHRDLKPDNVFLARQTTGAVEVKVLDFGVAKRTTLEHEEKEGTLTRTGAIVGTPFYMSPEQALGEEDIDARTDIWALGLMLYQGLSGVLPTRADNLGRVIKAVAMAPIEPLERLVPGLPAEIAALANRMLGKAREDRPRDMNEVRAVLERYESRSIDALAELDTAAPRREETLGSTTTSEGRDQRSAGSVRRVVSLAAAGAALLIGGGWIAHTTASRPRAPAASATTTLLAGSAVEPLPTAAPSPAPVAPASSSADAPLRPDAFPPHGARRAVTTAPARGALRPASSASESPAAPSPAPVPVTNASGAPAGIGVEREF